MTMKSRSFCSIPGAAPDLNTAYKQMLDAEAAPALDATTTEGKRRALVRQDLAQGRPALVRTDLAQRSAAEKAFVQHMLKVAASIDEIYAAQKGLPALSAKVPADPESQSLFRRNWGPKCLAPATQKNPECSAIPGSPQPIVDVWPAAFGKTPQTDRWLLRARREAAEGRRSLHRHSRSQRQALVRAVFRSVSRIGVDRGGRAERRRRRAEWRQRRTPHRVPARRRQRLHHQ